MVQTGMKACQFSIFQLSTSLGSLKYKKKQHVQNVNYDFISSEKQNSFWKFNTVFLFSVLHSLSEKFKCSTDPNALFLNFAQLGGDKLKK